MGFVGVCRAGLQCVCRGRHAWGGSLRSDQRVDAQRFLMAVGGCGATRAGLATRARALTTVESRCARIRLGGCWSRDSGVDAAAGHASSSSAVTDSAVRVRCSFFELRSTHPKLHLTGTEYDASPKLLDRVVQCKFDGAVVLNYAQLGPCGSLT